MKIRISLTVLLSTFIVFTMNAQINNKAEVIAVQLDENGYFPNNKHLPVLLYKNVFGNSVSPSGIEEAFAKNNWGSSWRNGIYSFHHYHSTAHEALGIYEGWAKVQIGGEGSKIVKIEKGDLVILPAGISHKKIESGSGFAVVGAYPDNQSWDMNYGKENEVERARDNILKVKLPGNDPVFGERGKMFDHWK